MTHVYCEVGNKTLCIIETSAALPRSRRMFSVVYLGPRANAELVPKTSAVLHTFHAVLPKVNLYFFAKMQPLTAIKIKL
jgi:hypothetical protein